MTGDRRLAQGLSTDRAPLVRPAVEAVVALGSNLGDRAATLASAGDDLGRLPLTDDVRVSASVETVAVGPDGPDDMARRYLNAVALVTTRLAPDVLLGYLHAIEERHGRHRDGVRDVRIPGSGDRTLDLDLVAYGDLVRADPPPTLPHPRAADRHFVLAPWLSLDPDATLAGRGRVADLLAALGGDARPPGASPDRRSGGSPDDPAAGGSPGDRAAGDSTDDPAAGGSPGDAASGAPS